VSVVLNGRDRAVGIREATRAAVLEASERLGYTPNHAARTLRRKHSNVLTLLVQDLANPCFVDIAVAARAAADKKGYELNVVDAGAVDAELRALDRLRGEGSDGVIVATGRHGTRPEAVALLRDLVEHGLPAVVLLDRSPDPRVPAIRVDVEAGAYDAVYHLGRLGYRRIVHLALHGSGPIETEQTSQGDRYRGYLRALAELDITPSPAWLVRGEDTLAGGYAMLKRLLYQSRQPHAILVYNDLTAIGVLRALHDVGMHVPRDVAVVGTDGIELGKYTTPALTTIDHPREKLGRLAAEVLCDLIAGKTPTETERVLPTRLIIRESCGASITKTP
jgi:DNA-binding LacI/PurR family transcriptional regulator